MITEDHILTEKLIRGELSAFNELFNQYANRLYGFSLRYLKSEVEAEELVQVVFVRVWEKRKNLRKDTSFKGFLFKITYNEIRKSFRNKSYHQAYVNEIVATANDFDNPEERYDYASVLEEVDKLIDCLPERRRLIFIKSRKEGKCSKEIAGELNISAGTVDNQISEALKFLRRNLPIELLPFLLFFTLFIK